MENVSGGFCGHLTLLGLAAALRVSGAAFGVELAGRLALVAVLFGLYSQFAAIAAILFTFF